MTKHFVLLKNCFWTDTYYSSVDEMEATYKSYGLEVVDHFAQDGLAHLLSREVDKWNERQFKIWCEIVKFYEWIKSPQPF